MGRSSDKHAPERPMRRSGEYVQQWIRDKKKNRGCKVCGGERLRKKELIAILDGAPRKDPKAQRKVLRLAAASLGGYCSVKCRLRDDKHHD
jgi:excinuclease UvrABC ATPase subunit